MSESGTPYHNIPEPLPISVDPSFRSTTPDASTASRYAAALGTAEEMFAFEQRTTAEGVATFYRVRYPSEIWTWVFSLNHAGRINGFSLRRSGRYKIYDVWLRNVTY